MWYAMIALLIVFAVALLWLARRQQWESWTIEQANREVYESRLAELQDDLEQGIISEKELSRTQQELQKTFVTDVHNPDEKIDFKPVGFAWPAVLVVVIALGIYIYDGSWQQQQRYDRAYQNLPQLSQWLLGDNSAAPQNRDELWNYALGLRQRLSEEPEANAWSLYGRLMLELELLEQALAAFEKSYDLEPNNYSNLMSYSQALLFSGSDRELAMATRFLGQVLRENPQNPEAFGLLGLVYYERADFERAVAAWDMTLMLIDEDDPRYGAISNSKAQAQARLDGTVTTLTVTVDVSEAVRNEMAMSPVHTLFLFVRDPDGGSAPIAVVRQRITDFPVTITLTDDDAMVEDLNLSSAQSWLVQARVTSAETMERRQGDMESRPLLVEREIGQQTRIVITELIP